jgi:hypothetical protein
MYEFSFGTTSLIILLDLLRTLRFACQQSLSGKNRLISWLWLHLIYV